MSSEFTGLLIAAAGGQWEESQMVGREIASAGEPGVVGRRMRRAAAHQSAEDMPAAPETLLSESERTEQFMIGEDRYRMIAEAAYFRAEQRGFVAGSEVDDWLAAEMEIDALLDQDLDRGGRA